MAKGSDELVKFIAERVMTFIETPREVRKQAKANQKDRREDWQIRWFGLLPLAVRMAIEQARKKRTPPKA